MRRLLFPILIGLGGFVVLTWLGLWQMQRLAWKTEILAEINARIVKPPVELPRVVDPAQDRFLPVIATGQFSGGTIPVFMSHDMGPIYRLISAFETEDNRRILVDRGAVPADPNALAKQDTVTLGGVEITGNLHWPDDVDSWTPQPDADGVHYGRDVDLFAEILGTEPLLIVARATTPEITDAVLLPVTSQGIPNNHLGYAVQWFGMALVWAVMCLYWGINRRRGE